MIRALLERMGNIFKSFATLVIILVVLLVVVGPCCLWIRFSRDAIKYHSSPVADHRDAWKMKIIVKEDKFHPVDIAISDSGVIYATDFWGKCVWSWRSDEGLKRFVDNIAGPKDIAIDGVGRIWVSERAHAAVWRISPNGGDRTRIDLASHVNEVTSLDFDKSRNSVVIFDRGWAKIVFVSENGDVSTFVDDPHGLRIRTGPRTWIWRAWAVAGGTHGEIYVFDYDGCVQTIFSNGKRDKRGTLTSSGNPLTELAFHPEIGLIITAYGVGQRSAMRMTVPEGKFELIYKSGWRSKFEVPCGVTISSAGVVYMCETSSGIIAEFNKRATTGQGTN